MTYEFPKIAIKKAKESLLNIGRVVEQKTWQSVDSPDKTIELLGYEFGFRIPRNIQELQYEVKPNLPWAEDHFQERIGGHPLNPGEQYKNWPHFKHVGEKFKEQGQFSHTYMERFWPKYAGLNPYNEMESRKVGGVLRGIRFNYGDYEDLIYLLKKDLTTRQAYLPIWFPEDTGNGSNVRVPCSLGYHIIIRNQYVHIFYFMRSCDIIRHFRDDIYLACRLVFDVIDQLKPEYLAPGSFRMFIGSLHCFASEKGLLLLEKT